MQIIFNLDHIKAFDIVIKLFIFGKTNAKINRR